MEGDCEPASAGPTWLIAERAPKALYDLLGTKEYRKEILGDRITHVIQRIKNRLKLFCDKELADDPESAEKIVSIEVCKGYPANEILKKAEALRCDLIVMGTHGKGIVSQAFFGSVAKRVLRRVRKPVFIIPLPEE